MKRLRKPDNYTWENEGDRWELFGSEGELVAVVEPSMSSAGGFSVESTGRTIRWYQTLDEARAAAEKRLL